MKEWKLERTRNDVMIRHLKCGFPALQEIPREQWVCIVCQIDVPDDLNRIIKSIRDIKDRFKLYAK